MPASLTFVNDVRDRLDNGGNYIERRLAAGETLPIWMMFKGIALLGFGGAGKSTAIIQNSCYALREGTAKRGRSMEVNYQRGFMTVTPTRHLMEGSKALKV